MAGNIANVLDGMETCEIVLTSMCGGGNVDILLTCGGNGVGSDSMMDLGLWWRGNLLVKNHLIQSK